MREKKTTNNKCNLQYRRFFYLQKLFVISLYLQDFYQGEPVWTSDK